MRSIAIVAAVLFAFSVTTFAADRDAQAVLFELRLKQMTKNLSLTDEQQKKVKALYDEEAKVTAKINSDENLSLAERTAKKQAAVKETNDKIKPLLTDEQKEKFEALLARTSGKKKPAVASPAGAPPKTPAAP